MSTVFPTGNATIDALESRSAPLAGVSRPGDEATLKLATAIALLAADRGATVTVFPPDGTPGTPEVVLVSQSVLLMMQATDKADFVSNVQQHPNFVHPTFQQVAVVNTASRTSAPHVLSLRRKNGSYIDVRINSFWFVLPTPQGEKYVRVSIWANNNVLTPA